MSNRALIDSGNKEITKRRYHFFAAIGSDDVLHFWQWCNCWVLTRVHESKSMQIFTWGAATAMILNASSMTQTTLFLGRYQRTAEHVHTRSLQKLDLFDGHFRLGLLFAGTCSSKCPTLSSTLEDKSFFFFLVQTYVGSDDTLDIPPWQHP